MVSEEFIKKVVAGQYAWLDVYAPVSYSRSLATGELEVYMTVLRTPDKDSIRPENEGNPIMPFWIAASKLNENDFMEAYSSETWLELSKQLSFRPTGNSAV